MRHNTPPSADAPDVSFLTVNWNGSEMLMRCLDSIYACTGELSHEVLIADNGSTDGSLEEAERRFEGIRVFRNSSNQGFARAVNQVLFKARGRTLCLLNNDAELAPGAIQTLVAFMEDHADCGIAGPQLVYPDGRLQNSFDNFPTLATECLNKSLLRWLFPRRYPSKRQKTPRPRKVESLVGAALCVKRAMVAQVGALDEDYFFYLEETDWCLRALRAGWAVWLVPTARVVHLQGQTRSRYLARSKVEYKRSMLIFFRKHRPAWHTRSLKTAMFLKSGVNVPAALLAAAAFAFLNRNRNERLLAHAYAWLWQWRGYPDSMGLSGLA